MLEGIDTIDKLIESLLPPYEERQFSGVTLKIKKGEVNLDAHSLYIKLQDYLKRERALGVLKQSPVKIAASNVEDLSANGLFIPYLFLHSSSIMGSSFKESYLEFCEFGESYFEKVDFTGAYFREAKLKDLFFRSVDFEDVNFTDAYFNGVRFFRCNFKNVQGLETVKNLETCEFAGGSFSTRDLSLLKDKGISISK